MKHKAEKLNKSALASALNLSLTSLKKHLGRPGAPKPDRKGLYDLHAVRDYVAGRQRLNNDGAPGDQSGALLGLRVEKLTLECEGLRRELAIAGERVSLSELAEWLGRFLDEVGLLLPSSTRPGLIMALGRVPGNHAEPVDLLRACTAWADGVRRVLIDYCRSHGVEVHVGSTVHRPDLAAILGRCYMGAGLASRDFSPLSENIPAAEVRTMFREFVESLRSCGVAEEAIQRAGRVATDKPDNPAEMESQNEYWQK